MEKWTKNIVLKSGIVKLSLHLCESHFNCPEVGLSTKCKDKLSRFRNEVNFSKRSLYHDIITNVFYSCFKYDKDSNLWLDTFFALNFHRFYASGGVAEENQWFVAGGEGEDEILDSVEVLTGIFWLLFC